MTPTATQAPTTLKQIPAYVTAPLPAYEAVRREQMAYAWQAYRGQFEPPLKNKDGRTAAPENAISNRCAPIVDKGVSFLFGQKLKIEVVDVQGDAQDYADGAWGDDDDKMTLLSKIAMNGGVCGNAFVRLFEPLDTDSYPRIVNLDPQIVSVITAEDDCDTVLAYLIEYQVKQGTTTLTKRQAIWRIDPDGEALEAGGYDKDSSWVIQHFECLGQNGTFKPSSDPVIWPYPFAPLADCQNMTNPNEYPGLSDLPPEIIALNETLNFSQSNANKILMHHAHPKVFIIGAEATAIQSGIEDTPCLPEGATVTMLEMHGDLAASMNFQRNLRSDMDEQSRVPAVALGRLEELPKGNISGVALQLLFMPLIEKTTLKQRLYGRLIREVCRRVLALGGRAVYDPAMKIELHWQNLLPVDDLAAAQTAMALKQVGVSNATLIQQLGYDPDAEMEKSQDEDAKTMQNYFQGKGNPPGLPPQVPQTPPAANQPPQGGQQ